jgi:hypothetical protein
MYTYKAGTTTNATTYSDDAGTPNTNPIVLNSDGECDLFLDDAVSYRIILKNSAGVTQFDKDRVASLGSTQVQSFDNIAALRLRSGTTQANAAETLGYYNAGDGGANAFYWDGTSVATDNGGTIIKPTSVSGAGRWLAVNTLYITPKIFGARGDGVADDTAAFVAANRYLMTRPALPSAQTIESEYYTLVIPSGIYKISGNRIFGSQIPTGNNGTTPPRMLQILGQGATLIWNVVNEDDELFYFDGTIANPRVRGLSIYTVRSSIISTGAGNIFRFYSNTALTNQVNASKLHVVDVSVWPGRYSAGGSGQRPKYVFLNTGNAMCDQMLIENCLFSYMQKAWFGQNDQAVNITFSSCSFYGASAGTATSTTYFDFTRMNDNFNIVNCSFSVGAGETLIKTDSPISGGFYVEGSGYNFTIDNTRIEIVAGSTSWNLCVMNFGKLNLRNVNMALGASSFSVKTLIRLYGLANINCDNVRFNSTDFYFPIATSPALGGGLNAYGAYFNNCIFNSRATTTFAWTDGVTDYAIKDTLISNTFWRAVRFVDCNYLNNNGFYTWEFSPQFVGTNMTPRQHQTVTFSQGGIVFGKECLLPPYQSIKKITLSMNGTLPDTFDTFRVWVGDRTLSSTFDVDNIRPDLRKNEYVLFEGDATVFYTDQTLQSIEVAAFNSGVESNGILSWITVEYAPIDARAYNLTTTADTIKMYRANRSVSSGTTAQRPNIDLYVNQQYFDTTLGKPIWYNGSVWKDAAGTTV